MSYVQGVFFLNIVITLIFNVKFKKFKTWVPS